jgi:hypothetical protein
MDRKIIQFQITQKDEVLALCDDGTMWISENEGWKRAPSIPQDCEKQ